MWTLVTVFVQPVQLNSLLQQFGAEEGVQPDVWCRSHEEGAQLDVLNSRLAEVLTALDGSGFTYRQEATR